MHHPENQDKLENVVPCPFCGSDDIVFEFSGSQGYCLCRGCYAMGPEDPMAADPHCDIDAAINIWNKRTPA